MPNYYSWTDDPVVANVHTVRATYYNELKSNMDKIRGYVYDFSNAYSSGTPGSVSLGQTAYSYTVSPAAATDSEVAAGTTNALRDALDDVNTSWGVFQGSWSWCKQYSNDSSAYPNARIPVSPSPASIRIRAVHVNELRDQLDLVDSSMPARSPFCGSACQVGCQLACQTTCQYACQGCNNGTCHDQMCGAW